MFLVQEKETLKYFAVKAIYCINDENESKKMIDRDIRIMMFIYTIQQLN